MSRTYRKYPVFRYNAEGRLWRWEECSHPRWGFPYRGWQRIEIYNEKQRDKKPWYKPIKSFKVMQRQQERTRMEQALREGKDLPRIRKSDRWNWT